MTTEGRSDHRRAAWHSISAPRRGSLLVSPASRERPANPSRAAFSRCAQRRRECSATASRAAARSARRSATAVGVCHGVGIRQPTKEDFTPSEIHMTSSIRGYRGRMVRTGRVDSRTTSSVTLPSFSYFSPVRPCVAITTRSTSSSSCSLMMTGAGLPTRTMV